MARRELIANKIEKFDDRPENLNTWKAAFKNMTNDVNITASEELALMLEYTTGESKRLVQWLRNAYVENPTAGVGESWKKLGERFGSTAVITNVHLNKLTMFPVLASKDNKGLQELGDLLLELRCAKEEGGLAGLKILDEPAFLKPVLVKLPEELPGRWQRHAYRFKSQYGVDYPPFREFASFIQEIAQERNDPFLPMESHLEKFPVNPLSNLQSNLLMTHLSDKASQHLGLTSQTLHSRAQLTGTLQDGALFTNYRIRLANAVPSGPCPSLKGRICLANTESAFIALPQQIT